MMCVTQFVKLQQMKTSLNLRAAQATRLSQARRAAGFKTPSEAIQKFGWKGSTYMAHENGQNGLRLEPAIIYGRAFDVDPGWLLTGSGRGPKDVDTGTPSARVNPLPTLMNSQIAEPAKRAFTEEKLRVLGMAECGPDGWSLFNGDVVDWVARPPNLAGAKDAYAVYIMGDSMEDRYHPGELAFIHPGKPVTPGAYVLVQKQPKAEGETPLAVIKRLVKRSGGKVILEQLNPRKTFTLPAEEVFSIHRVVGSGEA